MEMKLFASLIILLTCQVLHSRGEPSPDPQDVNLYLFMPNENEGKGGQRPASVETAKGSIDQKPSVESEKGSDYATDFEDKKKEKSNDKDGEKADDGEEFEYINNIHIDYGGGGGPIEDYGGGGEEGGGRG